MMRTKGVSSLGKYEKEDGIVYRQETRNSKDSRRLAVPEKSKETVLNTCHEDLGGGHFGFKKTFGIKNKGISGTGCTKILKIG
jgi:hypothetical protein